MKTSDPQLLHCERLNFLAASWPAVRSAKYSSMSPASDPVHHLPERSIVTLLTLRDNDGVGDRKPFVLRVLSLAQAPAVGRIAV